MGGSQRVTRAGGKAKAMEMCITGRMMGAEEAERSGLVARVVPADQLLDETMKTAGTIASMAPLAAMATKEQINAAFEMPLAQGIAYERRLRSEEHTSELPSLMRISYAVFCLTQTKIIAPRNTRHYNSTHQR